MIGLIDTNVVLSAALRDRLPERVVLFVASSPEFQWLVTPAIVAEYADVLRRPKFALDPALIEKWTELLESRAVVVEDSPVHVELLRDPKDAPILAAALASNADFLITGDRDLLDIRDRLPVRIVTVAEFAAEFQIV